PQSARSTPPLLLLHALATPEIYTLSLHDALPICFDGCVECEQVGLLGDGAYHFQHAADLRAFAGQRLDDLDGLVDGARELVDLRSEEHTSELQSRENLVCRLLLEKKKNK